MPLLGAQNPIEFFDELKESLTVLFYRDKGTKFVDAIAVSRVHKDPAVLQDLP
jgi:hypothetical protein